MRLPIEVVVEGKTDLPVLKRLLQEAGLSSGPGYVMGGKAALEANLARYNNAARFSCWLVLRDLDRDAACAPALRGNLLPAPSAHMRLHIAVHAVEAWLLADAESIGDFLAVARTRVPRDPEAVPRPKRALVDLASRSRKKAIRDALVPAPGTTARVGPGYAALLIEFATEHWRPAIAARRSPSLARLREFLRRAAHRGDQSC